MPKEHVRQSLERDAYLARNEDKETFLKRLKTSVERLSKAMSLPSSAREELLTYAEALLEQHVQTHGRGLHEGKPQNNSQNGALQEKKPSVVADGAGALD